MGIITPSSGGTGDNKFTIKSAKFYFSTTGETNELEQSASLKVWMEGGKINDVEFAGAGLDKDGNRIINVDLISSKEFESGETIEKLMEYDVVVFGTWDANGRVFFNENSKNLVEKYIDAGYGVLIGHDVIGSELGNKYSLGPLASKFGITLGSANCEFFKPYCSSGTISSNFRYWSKQAIVKKWGLLTEYPHKISSEKLTIPLTHTCENAAFGDVWMELGEQDIPDNQKNYVGDPDLVAKQNGVNTRYYLSTYNNVAMIQTGHSDCDTTEDERNVLANAIYYLYQRTPEKFSVDNSVKDTLPPQKPTIEQKNYDIQISSKDQDEKIYYKVECKEKNGEILSKSEKVSFNLASGIKSYYFVIDNNENTEIKNSNGVTQTFNGKTTISKKDFGKYLHAVAVDNSDHISETEHLYISEVIVVSPKSNPQETNPIPPPDNSEGKKKDNKNAIIGGVVGALAAAIIIAGVLVFILKKRPAPIDPKVDELQSGNGGEEVINFDNPLYGDGKGDDQFADDFLQSVNQI